MKIPRPLVHIARYLVTAALGWLVFPLQALGLYAVAVLAAILLGGDPGSPFFLLFGLMATGLAGVVIMLAVIVPATLAGELVARRLPWPGWRWAFAPIVAVAVAFLLSLAAVAVWAVAGGYPLGTTATVWALCLVVSVLPLAVTATSAYGMAIAPLLLRGAGRRLKGLRDSFRMKSLRGADPGGPAGG